MEIPPSHGRPICQVSNVAQITKWIDRYTKLFVCYKTFSLKPVQVWLRQAWGEVRNSTTLERSCTKYLSGFQSHCLAGTVGDGGFIYNNIPQEGIIVNLLNNMPVEASFVTSIGISYTTKICNFSSLGVNYISFTVSAANDNMDMPIHAYFSSRHMGVNAW